MHKLLISVQSANGVEFFLNEIFHGLYIVVRNLLDVFHPLRLSLIKRSINIAKLVETLATHTCQLWQWQLAKGDKIFYFNPHAITNKGVFRKVSG